VCDGVDLIKLDGDQTRKPGFVCIVDDTAALYNVCLFFEEALGCPADIVRVGTVIGVEYARVVCRLGNG
jgi:hypothetical protein